MADSTALWSVLEGTASQEEGEPRGFPTLQWHPEVKTGQRGGSILTLSFPHLEGQSICISLVASLQLECKARITPEDRWLSSHK